MKKIKIILSTIMLISIASFVEAQIVVTSTTASTKKTPTVKTHYVSTEVRRVSAFCKGEVIDDGGSEIKERGFCLSQHPNTTIEDSVLREQGGLGEFYGRIVGLTGGTRYYIRAFATNSSGTGYGEEKSFTTKSNSVRQKGLVIRPEIGIGVSDERRLYCNALCNVLYQFNPYISLGGGTGLNFSRGNELSLFSVPIYANVRGYFCNRKWSPYYDIKLGYNITGNKVDFEETNNSRYDNWRYRGFYADFGFGLQYKNYDFGIEVNLYKLKYDEYKYNYWESVLSYQWEFERKRSEILISFCLKFAYNFQVTKKK